MDEKTLLTEPNRKKSHLERPLHLFRSPVVGYLEEADPYAENLQNVDSQSLKQVLSKVGLTRSPRGVRQAYPHPAFARHSEATPSELFYDLFFVANLATFTDWNEVNNSKGLSNYVGYFCVLWFTWFQVALFDVRYSRDSVFDRICKIGQFGVMIGFSFVAFNFDISNAEEHGFSVEGKILSLILMANRLILFFQYLATTFWLRKFPATKTPLLLMSASSLIVAVIFFGISFNFGPRGIQKTQSTAYIAWFVVSVPETFLNILVSCIWRSASFKGTHLVERMSLMTLIVLGEGILGLSKAIGSVWQHTSYYPGLGAAILSVLLLVYSMFQLYFDTLSQEHFGYLRQQIWATLHFPLHLALVLFDEGTKQFVLWNTAIKQLNDFNQAMSAAPLFNQFFWQGNYTLSGPGFTPEFFESQDQALMDTLESYNAEHNVVGLLNSVNLTVLDEFNEQIKNGSSSNGTATANALIGWWETVAGGLFKMYNINNAAADAGDEEEILARFESSFSLYNLVLNYFYIATGVALLLILALWMLSKRSRHTVSDWVRIMVWFAVATAICLLALLDVTYGTSALNAGSFVNSNWVLPTPMLLMFGLLVFYHLPFGRRILDESGSPPASSTDA